MTLFSQLIGVLLMSMVGLVPPVGAATCPLEPLSAYKSEASAAVYYITDDCTKQTFRSPRQFFSYFESYQDITRTSRTVLDTIPTDTGPLGWGPRYNPGNGAIVKLPADPTVYLLHGATKYHIATYDVFQSLGYTGRMIEVGSEALLDAYQTGSPITSVRDIPSASLLLFEGSPAVYDYVRSSNNTSLRHITSQTEFRSYPYRLDRIIRLAPVYQAELQANNDSSNQIADVMPDTGSDANTGSTNETDTDDSMATNTDDTATTVTCEAVGDGICLYIDPSAPDDTAAGSYTDPYRTFYAALIDDRLGPGSVIYAMDGTFDSSHAMTISRNPYYSGDRMAMIGILSMNGYQVDTPAYDVPSGTSDAPITIAAYPGANPVIDMRGAYNTADMQAMSHSAVYVEGKSHWVIDGLTIYGGIVNIAGGSNGTYSHHITIRNNTIAEVEIDGGDNPGLVRIDRSYGGGGVHDITIANNTLHTIYDVNQTPETTDDYQHFGAVTILSRQEYEGYGIGTRDITIRDNTMYNLPQVFYFKNPMAGPITIADNTIRDSRYLGVMNASNVTMEDNLVVDVPIGWWRVGGFGYSDDRITAIDGNTATIRNNTFIGLDSLLGLRSGTRHTVTDNIFFGLTGQTLGAVYDTPAYIYQSEYYPDSLAIDDSQLQTVTSEDNCFFVETPYSQFSARYLPASVVGRLTVEHYTLEETQALFGWDQQSRVHVGYIFDEIFTSEYELKSPSRCDADINDSAEPNTEVEQPIQDASSAVEEVTESSIEEEDSVTANTYTVTIESPHSESISGNWSQATAATNHQSSMSLFTVAGGVVDTYRYYTPDVAPGEYEVAVWNSCYTPRNTNVLHTVVHANGTSNSRIDQDSITGACGSWQSLGTFSFAGGIAGYVEISDQGTTSKDGQYIGADAVRFVQQ